MRVSSSVLLVAGLAVVLGVGTAGAGSPPVELSATDQARIDELMAKMTPEEKAGQLNLVSYDKDDLAPLIERVKGGLIGGVLKVNGAARTRSVQDAAVHDTRLGIPLLFEEDVIHGYRTITPIPLGEAAAWDPTVSEAASRLAATEAGAAGIQLTYAPMVDIARDARWGRVMEGSGEDPWLGAALAAARVRGFQGTNTASVDAVLACPKHFAGYGDALAGIDYHVQAFSERTLREIYLPPFAAAIDAGAATLMCAYTPFDAVPATANRKLIGTILRDELGFGGLLISDWGTITELHAQYHVARNLREASLMALRAGLDVDMVSEGYVKNLPALLAGGDITQSQLDTAVRRVLVAKARAGLLDAPYRGCDEAREKSTLLSVENRAQAREIARRSLVLLKNDSPRPPGAEITKTPAPLLPLRAGAHIALIGPLVKEKRSPIGWWECQGRADDTVTLWDGMVSALGGAANLTYAPGCRVEGFEPAGRELIPAAVDVARDADVVVMAVGEWYDQSGEAGSRADLHLPGAQTELLRAVRAAGVPVVLVVYTGRPLVLTEEADLCDAMLVVWQPGTMGGPAIADALTGAVSPSGKLPVTFPRASGQVPIFYAYPRNSHNPLSPGRWSGRDKDVAFEPLFPFGYGLTYTTFAYSPVRLSADRIHATDLAAGAALTAEVDVTNTGGRAAREIVQLYLRDEVTSVVEPDRRLRGFESVQLAPGETKSVRFQLGEQELSMLGPDLHWVVEPGDFSVLVGPNSADLPEVARFRVE